MGVGKKDKTKQHSWQNEGHVLQTEGSNVVDCCTCSGNCSESHHSCRPAASLEATSSSPALLEGCSDISTHADVMEHHVQSHHIRTHLLSVPGQSSSSNVVPDSVFLTPSAQRQGNAHSRPFSAPASFLEQISGQLLRLVGDHYLCSNCGRQLRNMGDELTFEKSFRHVVSSMELNNIGNT